ncbi:MAG: thioredoxin family protein [Anaerorhabdus sp.]
MEIKMFVLENCPYCKKAKQDLEQLLQEERYQEITIKEIDEEKEEELAKMHDYYYVPSFYIQDKKIHEGATDQEKIRMILEQGLEELA